MKKIWLVRGFFPKEDITDVQVEEMSETVLAFEKKNEAEEFVEGCKMEHTLWDGIPDPDGKVPLLDVYESLVVEEVDFIEDVQRILDKIKRDRKEGA